MCNSTVLRYEMEWIRLRLSSKKLAEINQMITMPIISSQQQIIIIIIIKDKSVKRKITINKPNALRYGTILQYVYLTCSKKLTGIAHRGNKYSQLTTVYTTRNEQKNKL